MNTEQQQEHVELSDELSPIVLSIELYEFFMANGKLGMDAKTVWEHLVYTARKQATNQVWANNVYIQNGTGLGEKKVKEVKKWLADHNLIVYVKRTNELGQIVNWYIRVHGCKQLKATGAVSTRVENHPCGKDGQMLKHNNEILKNNNKQHVVDDFKEVNNEDTILDSLSLKGVEDFAYSREKVRQAVDNGLTPDEAYAYFEHCFDKAKGKDNQVAYALTLFANSTVLEDYKRSVLPTQKQTFISWSDILRAFGDGEKKHPKDFDNYESAVYERLQNANVYINGSSKSEYILAELARERETSDQSAVAEESAVGLF